MGKERFSQHPRPGIEVWEDIRSGRTDAEGLPNAVALIRSILKTARQPGTLNAEAWAAFSAAVDHGSEAELLGLIHTLEWGMALGARASLGATLTQSLVTSGRARDLTEARALYERLFLHVFKAISRNGISA